jgi:hypothetical protein
VKLAALSLLWFTCSSSDVWQPRPGTSWQWQLSGELDTSLPVEMYDVDLFVTPDAALAQLRKRGVKIVCYFSAGTHEPNRPDTGKLADKVIGKSLPDWPDERWLDIRSPAVRALVRGRLDLAVKRGCDGVEPDNVDAYANDSGFALTADDQLAFNRFVATEAHQRKLSVGLKNDLDQVPALVDSFDWALVEECMHYNECDALAPFIRANKAVFHVEYGKVCPAVKPGRFDTLIKHTQLDAFRVSCR